ncbi:LysR family transcriptional regulator [Cupriavidus alkaliphilus]|uniref:DNA-binding transcriptional LysR family regulator n=1 Tax=Cupriavidus alkaliphilus TaxID=942866 RepID=A0A7W4YQD7_9BURK|nr:LysR family transcriptional regulator [Cupriavidus alkaliphilus]MBB2917871.1 DNA-binding transcriptional LysR family regulator [Cupriavidus alkaliphilus]MBB3007408.1 DNA-binding transcriptional LysR family regulator [Cupriavidus alkaliphilus]PVY77762.1 LysR family transcriptional regulator [Cupriavidus alkaliphilus]SCB18764.1 transcriptional regulator, LysR family [Cupriavidus alkaliphilus]
METRDIEYILAVAAHGGIGRAAEALGISQPALTKAVQRVETQAGLPLFERTANGMAATYAGTRFLERARRIQLEYQDGIKEMLGIRTGEQGILRVGYSPSIPGDVVLGACQQLVRERPVARLRLRRRLARDLLDLLAAGELDMAVAPTPSGALADTFAVQPLFDDRLVVVADQGHALLRRRKLRLADLADQEWLLPERHITLRQQVDAAFRQRGLPEPQPRIEIDFGSSSLFALMQGTQMLSIANASGDAMQRGLRVLPLGVEELDLRRRIGVVTREGAYLSPLAQRLTVLLREHSG